MIVDADIMSPQNAVTVSLVDIGAIVRVRANRNNEVFLQNRPIDMRLQSVYPTLLGKIMQVAKWGNSLAVRLPVAVVEALTLKVPDSH